MTLNCRYALYCTERASFGAHQENLNEDTDPHYRGKNVACTYSTFWQYTVCVDIRRGSLGRVRQTRVGLSNRQFSAFSRVLLAQYLANQWPEFHQTLGDE